MHTVTVQVAAANTILQDTKSIAVKGQSVFTGCALEQQFTSLCSWHHFSLLIFQQCSVTDNNEILQTTSFQSSVMPWLCSAQIVSQIKIVPTWGKFIALLLDPLKNTSSFEMKWSDSKYLWNAMIYHPWMSWCKAVKFSNYLEVHLVHLAKGKCRGYEKHSSFHQVLTTWNSTWVKWQLA